MKKFEHIRCPLCQADNFTKLYVSEQYGDSSLGKMQITIGMCNECAFIYQNPQLTQEALAIHYQKNSSGDIYKETGKGTEYINRIEEKREFISEAIKKRNIENIGDIGGGAGVLLSSLDMPSKTKKYLIEPSAAINKNKDSDIIKIQEYIENLSSDFSSHFDLLILDNVLEHLKAPATILKKACSLLRKEGYVFVEVPNSLSPHETVAEFFSYEHINHFTHETLDAILCNAGFYPVKISDGFSGGTIMALYQKQDKELTAKRLFSFFDTYAKRKQQFSDKIVDRLATITQDGSIKTISVYGAGDHTRFLLAKCSFLIDKIEFFIDSDPQKWGKTFYGKEIIAPEEIKKRNIQHIVISSQRFEKEIYQKIHTISEQIHIIHLYHQ